MVIERTLERTLEINILRGGILEDDIQCVS